ncbi:MAG: FtsW/RodA/SpoVE family cell cycle protein [Lachnospiraceae bacterium]|nr:FtsW/RodA/SpoVE family cell cycle protein [Lachnospiraceae bacterium]
MINIITNFSRYVFIIAAAVYAIFCFISFGSRHDKHKGGSYVFQNVLMFGIHFLGSMIIYLNRQDEKYLYFYAAQVLFLLLTVVLYAKLYKQSSRLLINNMCFLLMVGFLYLTRLNYDYAVKQFLVAVIAVAFAFVIPLIIGFSGKLRKGGWLYGLVGLALVGSVFVIGKTLFGATNWIEIAGFSLQPSELAKIAFVFFLASMLYNCSDFKRIALVSVVAVIFVAVLVLEKDLGASVIFFMVYMVMLYVATKQKRYIGIGLAGMAGAGVAGYKLFSHVRTRFIAWLDPWSHYENEGYQIAQSLFAISTGGWFGLGLFKGSPTLIPIYISDFILSALTEEMGILFTICLILIYTSCFIMFINISLQFTDPFYKLVAIGLSVAYGFQVFLTVGGVIKLIPHTGVTLPLISYGGSSVLSTIIIFAVIQGLYVLCQREEVQESES